MGDWEPRTWHQPAMATKIRHDNPRRRAGAFAAMIGIGIPLWGAYGCMGTIPEPYIYPPANAATSSAQSPATVSTEGRHFCREVEKNARVRSGGQGLAGWTTGLLSLAAFGTGTTLQVVEDKDHETGIKAGRVAFPLLGAALAMAAYGSFMRARDAGSLAATATRGVNNPNDADAASSCNVGIAEWNGNRAAANDILEGRLRKLTDDAAAAASSAKAAESSAGASAASAAAASASAKASESEAAKSAESAASIVKKLPLAPK